ncbi:hypothetical protein K443DRAFT_13940 [Laccaria amethystina LaAM-08-1]|uniref:Actin-like ATPase domain-containing protein n=1 Tax=Laccaria amethystina LaAM-08-1 TaxID=1095629 RepID=A0A0C9WUB1_9AGAR|nr:hypothetical protein K443DRAFT_13940 [Laccaria amethystina LaAM-08-1]
MSPRSEFNGSIRKLVVAFDIGTTFSGISYSVLDPGQTPEIKGEEVDSDSKIPTIIYYDDNGSVCAVGAEAVQEGIDGVAENEGWTKADWFKLHLRPKIPTTALTVRHIPPLPPNKTALEVFADFLRYLNQCTRSYILETHANGSGLWESVEQQIAYVLTHPNGWEGAQQSEMRKAAVIAGLVPDTEEGRSRVSFVTEGEASLHYCIQRGLMSETVKDGDGVLIVDAGGGTIDISGYRQISNQSFEEMATPECHFQGSIFVTNRAREFLEDLLRGSRFFKEVDLITKRFDNKTKLGFRDMDPPHFLQFTSVREFDPKLNIRSGQLKLMGSDVASFFEPSVACIVKAVAQQRAASETNISTVFLVGGFAASDWLFSRVKGTLELLGINFCRPDNRINSKAVADGAIFHFLDHFVGAHMSKFTYGAKVNILYDPGIYEHLARSSTIFTHLDGTRRLPGAFSEILQKNTRVSQGDEFRKDYSTSSRSPSKLSSVTFDLYCARADAGNLTEWFDEDPEIYLKLCTIEADMTSVCHLLPPRRSRKRGKIYYTMNYSIILFFGMTELSAQIAWMENGVEKRSPARVVYDPPQ